LVKWGVPPGGLSAERYRYNTVILKIRLKLQRCLLI
jgi:hypothetical protein